MIRAASFIVLALEGLACWPDITTLKTDFTLHMKTTDNKVLLLDESTQEIADKETSSDVDVFFKQFVFITEIHLKS